MHKLSENYKAISLIAAVTATATATGTGQEMSAYGDDALFVLSVGTVSGTSPTLDVVIQSSSTVGGTYTTELTFGQVTASTKFACGGLNIEGSNSGALPRKFIRALATIAGTTPSFAFSVTMLVRANLGSSSLNSVTPA